MFETDKKEKYNEFFNLSTEDVDYIYLRLDESNNPLSIFVRYLDDNLELRNNINKDPNYKEEVKRFISQSGVVGPMRYRIEPLYPQQAKEMLKAYYIKKLSAILMNIDQNLTNSPTSVDINTLTRKKEIISQYINSIQNNDYSLIDANGFFDETPKPDLDEFDKIVFNNRS